MCQTPNLNFFPGRGDDGARGNAGSNRGQAGVDSRRGRATGKGLPAGSGRGCRWSRRLRLPLPGLIQGPFFPRLGFGRQFCLSLPGVPKNTREKIEDGLVLVLTAELVSTLPGGGGKPAFPPKSCKAQTCPLRSPAKLKSAARDQSDFSTAFSSPSVSGCVPAGATGATEHPRAVTAKTSSPCTPCRSRLLLLDTNPTPSTQLQPPHGGFDFVRSFVCLFVWTTRICL